MENDLKISELMAMQRALWQAHSDSWSPLDPEHGRSRILYMVEEIGEYIAILKKKGDRAVVDDPAVRAHFLEEMSDALMYFTDTLLCFGVTPEELSRAYSEKHCRNMGRNYAAEYKDKFES